MKENSCIRFNPFTKEIEIEGSEKFVKTYFSKLQAMMSGAPEAIVKEPKPKKVHPATKAKKKPKAVKAAPAKKEPKVKGITHIDTVVGLIQGSAEGISTAELKQKTELAESQIWNIVNRATKLGRIKKMKRGLYGAVDTSQK